MLLDYINATFELAGAAFQALNVLQIYKDKAIRGVHWLSVFFFTAWGWWNLPYYTALGQVWSSVGASALVLVNMSWLYLIWYYRKN